MSPLALLIVLIHGALSNQSFTSTCNYFKIKPKFKLQYTNLNIIPGQTLTRCARECFLRSQCLSITFNTTSNGCKLHTADDITHPSNLLPSNDTTYVGIYSWTLTRDLGGCATRPCPIQTRCTPLRNNNYTCIISECDYGVSIPHLTGWGWRPVGRTKTLRCNSNYYLNGTAISSTCLANGTWTYTSEIMAECLPIPETTTVFYNTTSSTNDSSTPDDLLNTTP